MNSISNQYYNDIFYSQIECTGTMHIYQGEHDEIYFLIYHFH